MTSFLYQFFHNETNDRTEKGLVKIPENINDWPEEWKKVAYKQYALFKSIPLSRMETGLTSVLSKRRSDKEAVLTNQVTLPILAHILGCGYGLQGTLDVERQERRTVPSAGQRYPLEIYPILFRDIDGCAAGVYHYAVRGHMLEPVTLGGSGRDEILSDVHHEWLADTTGVICISAVFDRMTAKYGSRGYRYALLEAGHVAQNMLLAATEKEMSLIPVGGANETDFEQKIGLMDSNERIIYMLFF